MRRLLALCVTSLLFINQGIAQEPTNLAVVKQGLIRYHDSGQYERDMNKVINHAVQYLSYRLLHKNQTNLQPAIILDIDETALSNYSNLVKLNFGGTLEEIRSSEDEGQDAAIVPTYRLYQYAQAHKIAVIFLTGRLETEREATERNLKNVGYRHWNELILRSTEYKTVPAAVYKTAMRKSLAAKGYDIWLNLGDQQSDLAGSYADKTFKLPNPYYFIP